MVKSKTLIEKQIKRKLNPELVETVIAAKKNKPWLKVAAILSGRRKNRININLDKINKEIKDEKTIVIPGKVLSMGEIDKKIKLVALGFSESAKRKLLNTGCKMSSIIEEIKSNPEAKGIKIIKGK